ncbi:MAG: ABC transporter ATP-binding protein/permease [Clostridia bacterium]|nr:ABC transporter ATP-binding protein/permease [Clostridia bacterium]
MLKLTNISKSYTTGDTTVQALKDVSLQFREGEFVSILGPSGCGKTTMLNIIGGLDRYDSGDLSVDGVSTARFKASDWDAYRNHSIGFVFQSYNLIGHQTVLANVELALTLAGISKAERRRRAKEALEKVGLGKEMKKKPNQLSGGQMQRVAIARALINDPEIILADEPTGALDSETSVQVMEILKEVAKERLVIMVTHNGELAEEYSTRIVKLKDGAVIYDSNPLVVAEYSTEKPKDEKGKRAKKKSMSLKTAFTLSLNNLMTKKGRTTLTSFAGSIGIIGIALILSLSSGFQNYIDRVQEETLSTYPLSINSATMNGGVASMMFAGEEAAAGGEIEPETVYSSTILANMYNAMQSDIHINDLKGFKEFIESDGCKIEDVATVQYDYGLTLNFYSADTSKGPVKADSVEIIDEIYLAMTNGMVSYTDAMASMSGMMGGSAGALTSSLSMDMWCELIDNQALLDSQYDVLAGHWPENYNEVVLCVTSNSQINEIVEFAMNLRSREELDSLLDMMFEEGEIPYERNAYTYDYLMNELSFKLVLNSDLYKEGAGGIWYDNSEDEAFLTELVEKGTEIKICGIIRASEESVAQSMSGVLGYTDALVQHIIAETEKSGVVKAQKADPTVNVLTGKPFGEEEQGGSMEEGSGLVGDKLGADWESFMTKLYTTNPELAAEFAKLMEDTMSSMSGMGTTPTRTKTSYESNLATFGSVDFSTPTSINIYPVDFASKDTVNSEIDRFNEGKDEDDTIMYTDFLDLMLSSISTIIDAISYVLIAFVSISLVVSSIMIGVITYISVLERTKEIGILRAMGASKRDIARVFNAETLIVGLVAGLLGIGVTVLLNWPINIIINNIAEIGNIAALPAAGAVILVAISMLLTFIAGLIPSRMASKKDPVVALRTE